MENHEKIRSIKLLSLVNNSRKKICDQQVKKIRCSKLIIAVMTITDDKKYSRVHDSDYNIQIKKKSYII